MSNAGLALDIEWEVCRMDISVGWPDTALEGVNPVAVVLVVLSSSGKVSSSRNGSLSCEGSSFNEDSSSSEDSSTCFHQDR